jgi:hypothetical protein
MYLPCDISAAHNFLPVSTPTVSYGQFHNGSKEQPGSLHLCLDMWSVWSVAAYVRDISRSRSQHNNDTRLPFGSAIHPANFAWRRHRRRQSVEKAAASAPLSHGMKRSGERREGWRMPSPLAALFMHRSCLDAAHCRRRGGPHQPIAESNLGCDSAAPNYYNEQARRPRTPREGHRARCAGRGVRETTPGA